MVSKPVNIKRLRTRKGWTQARLAQELGVSSNTVARWERGEQVPLPCFRTLLAELA